MARDAAGEALGVRVAVIDGGQDRVPKISGDDFARRFSLRARNMMWLLGAGVSAAAGIPTAADLVWEFKQLLFVSQRRVSPSSVADLSSPEVRSRLQAHIDSSEGLPPAGAADEYAALFEAAYPAEGDRRVYLDTKIAGAKPSYGHLVLATLMRAGLANLVWTTNFDPLVADACAKVYDGTGALTSVALEAPDLAAQCIGEGRWPVEIKLHGDFRSRRLKNTGVELRQQDQRLRRLLVDSCRRFGLVAAGFSGKDASVMDALEEALGRAGAFPSGLFWLHPGEEPAVSRVQELLARASVAGVDAALVQIENFDESMRDLARLTQGLDTATLDSFAGERQRWSPAPRPQGRCGWPVVRVNALPVAFSPAVCRRVVCRIGGHSEVRKAVEGAGVDLLAARTKSGVLLYGSDADARAAFGGFGITEFGLHTVDPKRLRYESGERGLLREALMRALGRRWALSVIRRRSEDLLAPADPSGESWAGLRRLVGTLSGTVPGHAGLRWREGISARLDWADNRLWLLAEPRTVFDGMTPENRAAAGAFARERSVKRYNRQLNDLVAFWAAALSGGGAELRALGIGDGVDAVFGLGAVTGFSRRARA